MGQGQYEVVREGRVAAPAETVFQLIQDFHEWPAWSPWEDVDPDMERAYSGAEHGVGAVYEWRGDKKAGAGRMEITSATAPSKVVIALDFIKPFKSSSTIEFTLTRAGDATDVTWRMIGAMTVALKVMGIFKSMDKFVGPDFEKGLARLNKAVQG